MHTAPDRFQDLSVSEIMQKFPQTIPVFIKHKMLCVGCIIAPYHSVADACEVHGLDEGKVYGDLNAAILADQ